MPRIELRDGQWAELRERISHGADKEIKRAYLVGKEDPGRLFESMTIVVRSYVRTFNILDVDGVAIPVDAPDAVERMPDDVVDRLFDVTMDLYKGSSDPNPPTPPSSDGSPSAGG